MSYNLVQAIYLMIATLDFRQGAVEGRDSEQTKADHEEIFEGWATFSSTCISIFLLSSHNHLLLHLQTNDKSH